MDVDVAEAAGTPQELLARLGLVPGDIAELLVELRNASEHRVAEIVARDGAGESVFPAIDFGDVKVAPPSLDDAKKMGDWT